MSACASSSLRSKTGILRPPAVAQTFVAQPLEAAPVAAAEGAFPLFVIEEL
jgi:hypothetical protein